MSEIDSSILEPVLIIDDAQEVSEYLEHLLSKMGFKSVTCASCFSQAKTQLERHTFKLVFLDIELPDSNGKNILDFIANHHPDTLVVMCSGHNTLKNVQETWEKGAKGFLSKPFDEKKVLTVIKRLSCMVN